MARTLNTATDPVAVKESRINVINFPTIIPRGGVDNRHVQSGIRYLPRNRLQDPERGLRIVQGASECRADAHEGGKSRNETVYEHRVVLLKYKKHTKGNLNKSSNVS